MKQLFYLTFWCLLATLNLSAQTQPINIDSNTVYTKVENMPSYPGDNDSLSKTLTINFDFSKETKIERCYYSITVNKIGEITEIKKIRGDLKNEDRIKTTLKKTSGYWIAGTQNGNKVIVNAPLTLVVASDKIKATIYR